MGYGCRCGCENFREHALGVNFSGSAMPTRRPEVTQVLNTEKRWDADMPAYKRLREEGLQPKHIDGSAELEARATDPIEVTKGATFGSGLSLVKDVSEALSESSS